MQYITFKRGGRGDSVLMYSVVLDRFGTVMSCIDASVRIVTKSPKVGPLYLYFPSLCSHPKEGTGMGWCPDPAVLLILF